MKIVVQKFGGTSVSTQESRTHCIKHIREEVEKGKSVVVVVSAMGRSGQPYATDTLLSLAEGNDYLSERDKDILLSTGELISASVFSAQLSKEGIDAVILTGGQAGIITNETFGAALIVDVVPRRVIGELEKGKVVIVPGFQGQAVSGEITTLGRGGSDTTAAALAAGLKAEYCDIFTDVEGIMTADPRVVEDAKYLEKITYEDVAQMALNGASVIHPRAVDLAMNHEIPMRIRSTFSDKVGTIVSRKGNMKREYDAKEVMISGVVSTAKIHRFIVEKEHSEEVHKNLTTLFSFLKNNLISIDFINVTKQNIYFTVTEWDSKRLNIFLEANNFQFKKEEDVSKVSVVGNAISGVPGIMGSIIETLTNENIEVIQTSDSNTTIWIMVPETQENKAVQAIHKRFFNK